MSLSAERRPSRTTLGLLLGAGVACVIAWQVGGTQGTGIALGFLLGAGLSALGAAWQMHCLRFRPKRAMQAQVEAFLAKLIALVACGLLLRSVDVFAQVADWRSFLLGFAASVALVLPLAAWDTVRVMKSAKDARLRVSGRPS
jgi:hypothetical protein